MTLTGLDAGTLYHYMIFATDRSLNDVQSEDRTVRTEVLPPVPSAPVEHEAPVVLPKNAVPVGSGSMIVKVDGVPAQITDNILLVNPGSVVTVILPPELTAKPISGAIVNHEGNVYKFTLGDDGTYSVNFPVSPKPLYEGWRR